MTDRTDIGAEDVDLDEVVVPTQRCRASTHAFHIPHDDEGVEPLCDTKKKNLRTGWRRLPIETRPIGATRLCARCAHASDEFEYEIDTKTEGPQLSSILKRKDVTSIAQAREEFEAAQNEFEQEVAD